MSLDHGNEAMTDFVNKLVSRITSNEYALRVIEALGRARLVRGNEGFRGVVKLNCGNNTCEFHSQDCPGYVLASIYVLSIFRNLLRISAKSKPIHVLSEEAYGVILERLAYTAPQGLYENLIHAPDIDTPENRFLKFILNSAMKCRVEAPKWLINEVNWALKLTWLSKVTDVDRIDLRELMMRKPHLNPPYDVLLEIGGTIGYGELGVEHVYRLLEIYVLGLIIKSTAQSTGTNTNIDITTLTSGGLSMNLGDNEIYYQASLTEICGLRDYECWIPDIVLINRRNKTAIVIEVKATAYMDYLRDGALQALNYARQLRECLSNINTKPLLTYYGTDQKSINQLTKCLREELKLINLKIDKVDEDEIRNTISTVPTSITPKPPTP